MFKTISLIFTSAFLAATASQLRAADETAAAALAAENRE
jgi:hypothetical protein